MQRFLNHNFKFYKRCANLSTMKIRITPAILRDFPSMLLGAVIVKNVDNSRLISAVQQLVRGAAAAKQRDFVVNKERASLRAFQAIQKEKSRLENLVEIVAQGRPLVSGTPIEDIMLYFGVRAEMPFHAEDLDEVCGDIELMYSDGTEAFRAVGTTKLEHPVAGEFIWRDRAGVTCRHLNAAECERTAPVNITKNLVIITENFGFYTLEKMKEILKEMGGAIQKYCHGTIELHILGERVSEVDLGITGRTGISENDFRPNLKRLEFHQKIIKKQSEKPQALRTAATINTRSVNILQNKIGPKFVAASTASKTSEKSAYTEPSEMETKKLVIKKPKSRTLLLPELIRNLVIEAAKKAFSSLGKIPEFGIDQPKEESHGDYACNIALILAKTLKSSPREIAEKILTELDRPQYIESVKFAPPGFLNFFIAEKWLKKELTGIIEGKSPYENFREGLGRTIIVEYSSPNVAKPLGAHHLITTILGQALYNIYKFLGFKAISINHIGDWGTQFGKLLVAIQKWGARKKIEKNPIDELLALYVKFHDTSEGSKKEETENSDMPSETPDEKSKSPESQAPNPLDEEARAMFKKLEQGDEEARNLWQWIVDISTKDVEKTYKALGGIHFDYVQGESFYEDKMEDIIKEGIKKKIFTEGEGGSLIAKFDNETLPPMLVKKSDGATLYATRDLAQMTYRIKTWHPEKILYVVDSAQSLHFQQLIETMKKFDTDGSELIHVSFGRMSFRDGKMSTRKGNIIKMNEVLQEAVEKAKKLIQQKEGGKKAPARLAVDVGVGAIKYNILCQNRVSDIVFDWDKMLSLEGNSSPYLQYSYARTQSILRKAEELEKEGRNKKTRLGKDEASPQTDLFEALENADLASRLDEKGQKIAETNHEKLLMRMLVRFPETLLRVAEEYKPNLLCQYLYELGQEFNAFYHASPVLHADSRETREFRLKLVQAVGATIRRGLTLLGIEPVEKM